MGVVHRLFHLLRFLVVSDWRFSGGSFNVFARRPVVFLAPESSLLRPRWRLFHQKRRKADKRRCHRTSVGRAALRTQILPSASPFFCLLYLLEDDTDIVFCLQQLVSVSVSRV